MDGINEINKAIQRVGDTPIARFQWVLRFAQSDLNSFSIGDWINFHAELSAFQLNSAEQALNILDKKHRTISYTNKTSPIETEIIEFQKWIKICINGILKKEAIRILLPTFAITLSPPPLENMTEPWIRREASKDLWAIAKHAVMILFGEFAHKLRCCPGCSILFLADRKNQNYCSRNCQSRVKMRQIKGITPERYGKYDRKK